MKKKTGVLVGVLLLVAVLVSACATAMYDEEEVIGLTSAEVVTLYGAFDVWTADPDVDGLYRSAGAGYLTKEKRVGFFGTAPEEFYLIHFDENGIAYKITEDYIRPGG